MTLPPCYPRDPVLLEDWARYLDCIRFCDQKAGEILKRLETEGILDQTTIILMGDNGISHARGKQFLYDEGIRTPFIVRGPGIARGTVRNDLIEHIDMAATGFDREAARLRAQQTASFINFLVTGGVPRGENTNISAPCFPQPPEQDYPRVPLKNPSSYPNFPKHDRVQPKHENSGSHLRTRRHGRVGDGADHRGQYRFRDIRRGR